MDRAKLIEITRTAVLYRNGWKDYARYMGCTDADIARILDTPETAKVLVNSGAAPEDAIAF